MRGSYFLGSTGCLGRLFLLASGINVGYGCQHIGKGVGCQLAESSQASSLEPGGERGGDAAQETRQDAGIPTVTQGHQWIAPGSEPLFIGECPAG